MPAPERFHLELREIVDADLAILFEHQRDPRTIEMMAFRARDASTFDGHWARIRTDPTITLRTIVVDGVVAGSIVSWADDSGERDVGYGLGREFWGRGIATERPLHGRVAKHNLGSRRVLEKCGFVVIGEDRWQSGYSPEPIEELILRLDA